MAAFEFAYKGRIKKSLRIGLILLMVCFFVMPLWDQTAPTEKELEKRVMALWKAGSLNEMVSVLNEALKRFPQNPILWDCKGSYHLDKKEKNDALIALQRAITLQPTPTRYQNLAWLHYNLFNDYQSALIYFEKCEELAVKQPAAYFFQADCYEKTGNKKKAMAYFEKYLAKGGKPKMVDEAKARLSRLRGPAQPTSGPPPDDSEVLSGPQDPPRPDCCFHIWAAGCNLGWVTTLLKDARVRTRWEPADQTSVNMLRLAGRHIRAAYYSCSRLNPAWPSWRSKKEFLDRQADRLRQNPNCTTRGQVYQAVQGLYHWAEELKHKVVDTGEWKLLSYSPTCAEEYFLLGLYLCRAQQAFKIAQEWRANGRSDWNRHISDAQFQLGQALGQLEKHAGDNRFTCVDIKSLTPEERIKTIKNPQNMYDEMDQRTAQLDGLISGLQRIIETQCVKCHDEPYTDEGDASGRLHFSIAKVRYKPWTSGGEVYVDLNITLDRNGGPVTLTFPRRLELRNKWNYRHEGLNASFDVCGTSREFKEVDLGWKFMQVLKNGQLQHLKKFSLQPGETVTILYLGDMQVYDDYPGSPSSWDQAQVCQFEYQDGGQTVRQFTPVISPCKYWNSFLDMCRQVPPKWQR